MSETGVGWRELRALFERAVESSDEERVRLLEELGRSAPARARDLAELLGADGLAGSPLDVSTSFLLEQFVDVRSRARRARGRARSPVAGSELGVSERSSGRAVWARSSRQNATTARFANLRR